jgi:hypothetical protein
MRGIERTLIWGGDLYTKVNADALNLRQQNLAINRCGGVAGVEPPRRGVAEQKTRKGFLWSQGGDIPPP